MNNPHTQASLCVLRISSDIGNSQSLPVTKSDTHRQHPKIYDLCKEP